MSKSKSTSARRRDRARDAAHSSNALFAGMSRIDDAKKMQIAAATNSLHGTRSRSYSFLSHAHNDQGVQPATPQAPSRASKFQQYAYNPQARLTPASAKPRSFNAFRRSAPAPRLKEQPNDAATTTKPPVRSPEPLRGALDFDDIFGF